MMTPSRARRYWSLPDTRATASSVAPWLDYRMSNAPAQPNAWKLGSAQGSVVVSSRILKRHGQSRARHVQRCVMRVSDRSAQQDLRRQELGQPQLALTLNSLLAFLCCVGDHSSAIPRTEIRAWQQKEVERCLPVHRHRPLAVSIRFPYVRSCAVPSVRRDSKSRGRFRPKQFLRHSRARIFSVLRKRAPGRRRHSRFPSSKAFSKRGGQGRARSSLRRHES